MDTPYTDPFRKLVDNSPAIMWVTDTEARCTYLSRQWYEVTGRTAEEDLGYGWVENVHPDDRKAAGEAFFHTFEARGRISIRYRLRQKDGTYRWSIDSGLPNLAPDGTFLGYIGTVIDIHDQVVTEIEVRNMRERFTRSAAATDLGIWYCDLPFDELTWNTEVKTHFFLPADAHVTIDTFYDRIHPEDREKARQAISHSIEQHAPYDIIFRTWDGSDLSNLKWIRAIGWTDYNEAGAPIRFDGITLDHTSEHQRQIELKNASEAKTRFLANMSHEIRTPLSAILGYSDLLLGKLGQDEETNSFITRISQNSIHLSSLVDELLDLSKIEADKFEVESEPVDIETVLENVRAVMSLKAKEKGLELRFHPTPKGLRTLQTDPVRLTQILTNIVGNAVKFTERGAVDVSFEKVDATFIVNVQDTGIGLSFTERSKLFEPFTQADSSVTRRYGGTGLGLSLSRKLARLLKGDLKLVTSDQGVGSLFQLSIPIGETSTQSTSAPAPAAPTKASAATLLAGRKILLVDDSPDNRLIVSRYLRSSGAVVREAGNGKEGLEMALQGDDDIVLMDIQMPVLDGHQAVQQLRAKNYQKPIVALTAHAFREEKERCLSSGFSFYLTKPINRTLLVETIQTLTSDT